MFSRHYGSINQYWYVALFLILMAFQFAQPYLTDLVAGTLEKNEQEKMEELMANPPKFSELGPSEQLIITELNKNLKENNIRNEPDIIGEMKDFFGSGIIEHSFKPGQESQFLLFLLVLGTINNFALLWLIVARVNNIGWEQFFGLILFSPYLIILFIQTSPIIHSIMYYLFLAIAAALAFIPSNFKMFDDDSDEEVSFQNNLKKNAVTPNKVGGQGAPLFGKR